MKSVDDEETIEETVEMIDQMISHLKASSPDKTTSLHVKPEQVTLPLVELSKTLQESGQPIDDKEEEASRPPPERSPDDAYHEIELTNTTVAKEQITDQDEGKAVTDTGNVAATSASTLNINSSEKSPAKSEQRETSNNNNIACPEFYRRSSKSFGWLQRK